MNIFAVQLGTGNYVSIVCFQGVLAYMNGIYFTFNT